MVLLWKEKLISCSPQVLLPISPSWTNFVPYGAYCWRPTVYWKGTHKTVSQKRCFSQGLESIAQRANTATGFTGKRISLCAASFSIIACFVFNKRVCCFLQMNGEPEEENLNKSEISQVFEIALKRNLPVNFEVSVSLLLIYTRLYLQCVKVIAPRHCCYCL